MLRILIGAAMVLAVFFLEAEAGEDTAFLREVQAETGAESVDCFLPGQIRPLGSSTYITRGRTIKTTKKECEARGGRLVNPEEPETEIQEDDPPRQDNHSPR